MKPQPGGEEPQEKDFPLIVLLAIAAAMIGIVVSLAGLGDGGKSGAASSPPRSSTPVGAISHLIGPPEKDVVVGINEEALDQFRDAALAHDNYGKQELVLLGRVFLVPGGTRVRILKRKFTMVRVRVLVGSYSGRAGWVSVHQLD